MKRNFLTLLGMTALIGGTITAGWWPVTVFAGALCALLAPIRRPVLLSFVSGMLGWGLPLVIQSFYGEIVKLASALGGILGLGGAAAYVVLLLPSILGGLLALSGAWVVHSVTQVLPGTTVTTNDVDRVQNELL